MVRVLFFVKPIVVIIVQSGLKLYDFMILVAAISKIENGESRNGKSRNGERGTGNGEWGTGNL